MKFIYHGGCETMKSYTARLGMWVLSVASQMLSGIINITSV